MTQMISNITSTLFELAQKGIEFIAYLIVALILLIIGHIVAKIVSKSIQKLVKYSNVDQLMDKVREVDIFAGVQVTISEVIGKICYWLIFTVFFMVALDILELESVTNGIYNLIAIVPRIISAVIFFVVGAVFANVVKNVIISTTKSMGVSTGRLIGSVLFYFILAMVSIVALNQAGLETDILSANIQIILGMLLFALAIGFGLSSRGLFANFLGAMYNNNKFQIGQVLEIEETRGKVVGIDATSITLAQESGAKVVFPLSTLTKSKVIIHD